MSYTMNFSLALGAGKAGLSDLRAQLVDSSGVNSGSALTTGFSEIGQGFYLWTYASFTDDFRGGVKFYSAAASSIILGFSAINPEEAEYTNAKTSTRAIAGDAMTLTSGAIDNILDEVVEGSTTMRQMLRLLTSFVAAKTSGGGTTTIAFRDLADTKDRISMTVDANGDRSSVTIDAS